jgi:hypothetical protein
MFWFLLILLLVIDDVIFDAQQITTPLVQQLHLILAALSISTFDILSLFIFRTTMVTAVNAIRIGL